MEITQITVLEDVELNNPVFIEALPGIGHVGKLAADHMIDEFNATKFAEIYQKKTSCTTISKERSRNSRPRRQW